jgi:branched-chain amino acid transport system permease protein
MKYLNKQVFQPKVLRIVLVILLVFVLPKVVGVFWIYLISTILLLALFSLSFNLLFGMTGYLPFGHMAFYATGAYATGLLMIGKVPLLPAVLLGTAITGVLAVIIGFFCVRYTYVYFSLLTLAFGMMIHAILWKWSSVTGGDDGLMGIPRGSLGIPGLIDIPLESISEYYYFLAIMSLLAIYIIYRICSSPFGLILNGLRENFGRVEFAGVPTRRYLLYLFVISGLFAGLAGALMVPLEKTVSPGAAHWAKGAEPLMATLIGGPFTFWGPIVGAVFYIGLKEIIVWYTSYWLLVLGVLLLIIVLGFRGGIVGFAQDRLRERRVAKVTR